MAWPPREGDTAAGDTAIGASGLVANVWTEIQVPRSAKAQSFYNVEDSWRVVIIRSDSSSWTLIENTCQLPLWHLVQVSDDPRKTVADQTRSMYNTKWKDAAGLGSMIRATVLLQLSLCSLTIRPISHIMSVLQIVQRISCWITRAVIRPFSEYVHWIQWIQWIFYCYSVYISCNRNSTIVIIFILAIAFQLLTQSCPWVGSIHGLGWVGSGWVEIFQLAVGWVGLGRIATQTNIFYYCGGLHN